MRDYPPNHPGEILFEEFMKPMGISQYRLGKILAFRRCGSTRLSMSREGSAPIPRYALLAILVCPQSSGLAFKPITKLKWPK